MICSTPFSLHAWVGCVVFIQTFILLVFLLKAQELFIAGFSSFLATTVPSSYSRYKLHVNSIHRQSEAALEALNILEASPGWRRRGPEWVMVPKVTKDGTGLGYKEG